jgi:ubiquinone/menaquinone biosynthesis C-methylase UbiE
MESQNTRPVCDYEDSQYQTEFWEHGGREYEDRVERIALQHLLPQSGSRCLEIGAGAGRLTRELDAFDNVVILDYSRTQLQQAQSRLGRIARYTYVAANAYNLPFASGVFDAALMVRVIHHLADAQSVLSSIHNTLRPNGTLVLEFANKRNLKAILRYLLRKQSWNPFNSATVEYNRLNYNFHPSTIMNWLNDSGYIVGQQRPISHFRWNYLKRIIPTDVLVKADSLLQFTGKLWKLTPSIMLSANASTTGPTADSNALFQCPNCDSNKLKHTSSHLMCPNCGCVCVIKNGIYDFKQPNQTKGEEQK